MAGNYYHDPRPFYGLDHHNLISMDEVCESVTLLVGLQEFDSLSVCFRSSELPKLLQG